MLFLLIITAVLAFALGFIAGLVALYIDTRISLARWTAPRRGSTLNGRN